MNINNIGIERLIGKWKKCIQIPCINETSVEAIAPNSLVRFRGMVQDMFDPEFYLGKFELCNKRTSEKVFFSDNNYNYDLNLRHLILVVIQLTFIQSTIFQKFSGLFHQYISGAKSVNFRTVSVACLESYQTSVKGLSCGNN